MSRVSLSKRSDSDMLYPGWPGRGFGAPKVPSLPDRFADMSERSQAQVRFSAARPDADRPGGTVVSLPSDPGRSPRAREGSCWRRSGAGLSRLSSFLLPSSRFLSLAVGFARLIFWPADSRFKLAPKAKTLGLWQPAGTGNQANQTKAKQTKANKRARSERFRLDSTTRLVERGS